MSQYQLNRLPPRTSRQSWQVWLKRLTAKEPWRSSLFVAEMAAREWRVEDFLREASCIRETADLLLDERPQWGQEALRDALPYFVDFCVSAGADPRLKPLYESLFLVVAVDAQISLPQVSALLKITDGRLQIGVTTSDYIDILHQLTAAIQAIASPSVAEIALDALEILVSTPCPDIRERQQFAIGVATLFQCWYRRIDAAQFVLLRNFSAELGLGETIFEHAPAVELVHERSDWIALNGKRVAMYSLQESALRRAGERGTRTLARRAHRHLP